MAISGLLWGGNPGRLIDAAIAGRCVLASSPALLAELQGVLRRPKFASRLEVLGLSVDDIFDGYAALVRVVHPRIIVPMIDRDPDDDQVLAAAVTASANLIVSGDAHLLEFERHAGIDIITAAAAVQRIDVPG